MGDSEIELISDGAGLAVIGHPKAVELFLGSEGLSARDLDLPRLSKVMGAGGGAVEVSAQLAEHSGRWVQLTSESAAKVKAAGGLMPTKTPGVSHAMIGKPGEVKSWLQVAKGPGTLGANPALLAGAAGVMTQLAMQQAMNEVTDYLERIDAKLDDVLRAQKDAVVSMMIGVGFDIEEAMTLREHVGRVNEVTWSKVQTASSTIARTQSYALLQLDALADKLEDKARISSLLDAAKEAEQKTQEWLTVLARCFQLQDAIAILEIDRVMETAPGDLDGHRIGLKAARAERLDGISRITGKLLDRMAIAASTANQKVLFNPSQSPAVVKANSHVASVVGHFHERLGIEASQVSLDTRSWGEAVSDVRDRARQTGAETVGAAKRLGIDARERARSMKGRLPGLARRGESDVQGPHQAETGDSPEPMPDVSASER